MARKQKHVTRPVRALRRPLGRTDPASRPVGRWVAGILVLCAAALIVARSLSRVGGSRPGNASSRTRTVDTAAVARPADAPASSKAVADLPVMEINQAVMVTVELDFGPRLPTIAEALRDIERRHQPDDGVGRTFAVLDAYGEPTPDGRKLHLSMHVSAEKPGVGALVFRRTGEVLWQSRLVTPTNSGTASFAGHSLMIYLDNGSNKLWTVDGSGNPASILEANIKELEAPLHSVWPDGTEREFTYIYSACGCPVKVKVKRTADRTVRTSDLPVIFPDDPAVVTLISRLMRW